MARRRFPKVRSPRGRSKIGTVMGEFQRGQLRSSAGQRVPSTRPDIARAIAMSEGRKAERGVPFRQRSFLGRRRSRPVLRRRGRG